MVGAQNETTMAGQSKAKRGKNNGAAGVEVDDRSNGPFWDQENSGF